MPSLSTFQALAATSIRTGDYVYLDAHGRAWGTQEADKGIPTKAQYRGVAVKSIPMGKTIRTISVVPGAPPKKGTKNGHYRNSRTARMPTCRPEMASRCTVPLSTNRSRKSSSSRLRLPSNSADAVALRPDKQRDVAAEGITPWLRE